MSGYSLSCIFRHLQRLFNTYITKMIRCKLEKMCPAHQHCNFIPLSVTESRGYIIYSQINMTGGGDTWFELLCMTLFIWAHTLHLPIPNGSLPCTFPMHETQGVYDPVTFFSLMKILDFGGKKKLHWKGIRAVTGSQLEGSKKSRVIKISSYSWQAWDTRNVTLPIFLFTTTSLSKVY